jgi:hypothetical protein
MQHSIYRLLSIRNRVQTSISEKRQEQVINGMRLAARDRQVPLPRKKMLVMGYGPCSVGYDTCSGPGVWFLVWSLSIRVPPASRQTVQSNKSKVRRLMCASASAPEWNWKTPFIRVALGRAREWREATRPAWVFYSSMSGSSANYIFGLTPNVRLL